MSNYFDYFGCVVNTTNDAVDLIVNPLQHINFSSFRGVVFSTKETDTDDLISKASKIYVDQSSEYEAETQTFHFDSGATISFRTILCNEDVLRYGGMHFNYLGLYGFDCFREMQLRYLLRRVKSHFMEPYTLAFTVD